jgi:hypothetical protein
VAKGKYKRKKQSAHQKAQSSAPRTIIVDYQKASDKNTETSPERAKKSTQNKNPSQWDRLKERLRCPSITDWCIAVFTFFLAASAIYQFILMDGQLNVMRKDQRAWLKVEPVPDVPTGDTTSAQIAYGQPVVYPLRITNTGKSPARKFAMKIFIDIIDASQEPPLDRVEDSSSYPNGGSITAGIIFPNADFKQPITRVAKGGTPVTATIDEVNAIKTGGAYLAVYGIINYDDIFNAHHWTKFCTWIAGSRSGSFHAQQCAQYNNVDDN